MKIQPEILEIIENGRSEDNLYFLPSAPLDRKIYVEVNKVLELLGGKWNKKLKAHLFESPIDDAISNVIATGEVTNHKKELQFFETPSNVATHLCNLADLKPGLSVLESSAGRGRILQALIQTGLGLRLFWCEIDNANCAYVEKNVSRSGFIQNDFLTAAIQQFDRVVMNPPFSNQQDIDHVTHALKFIDEKGILVSVMSPAIKFRTNRKTNEFNALLKTFRSHEIIDLPENSFNESGTTIKTVILKVRK